MSSVNKVDSNGNLIEIANKTTEQYFFTRAEWDAIVDKSIYDGSIINITDDQASGVGVVVDEAELGNLNPITSNAVAEAIDEVNNDLNKVLYTNSNTQSLLTAIQSCASIIANYNDDDFHKIKIIIVTSDALTLIYRLSSKYANGFYFGTNGILTSWYTVMKEVDNYVSKKCVLGTGSSDYNPTITSLKVVI